MDFTDIFTINWLFVHSVRTSEPWHSDGKKSRFHAFCSFRLSVTPIGCGYHCIGRLTRQCLCADQTLEQYNTEVYIAKCNLLSISRFVRMSKMRITSDAVVAMYLLYTIEHITYFFPILFVSSTLFLPIFSLNVRCTIVFGIILSFFQFTLVRSYICRILI